MHSRSTRLIVFAVMMTAAFFAHADTAVRYVSADGDNTNNNGLSESKPFKTVRKAVEDLGAGGGEVRVLPGKIVYESTRASVTVDGADQGFSYVELTAPITIVGTTGNPADVVISRYGAGKNDTDLNGRIFTINHPDVLIKDVTITGGRCTTGSTGGGNVFIGKSGGVIEHCIISSGISNTSMSGGHNVYMCAGRVSRTVIRDGTGTSNGSGRNGSGAYMEGGVIENSLICANSCADGASIVANGPASVVNCTIVDNVGDRIGGVKATTDAKIVNCLINGNTVNPTNDKTGHQHVWANSADGFDHCLGEVQINENCLAGDPAFVSGTYELSDSSPAVDAGKDYAQTDAISTLDLAGNPRVVGLTVDVGCYENQLSDLSVSFVSDTSGGNLPLSVAFTASIPDGIGDYTVSWDFDGDDVWDSSKQNDPQITHTYLRAGTYTVRLKLEADGVSEVCERKNFISVVQRDFFVDCRNVGNAVAPYDTPATAATTVQEAIALAQAGSRVLVADGVYVTDSEMLIDKGITVMSISGDPSRCMVTNTMKTSGSSSQVYRNARVKHVDAVLAGLTLAGADGRGKGGCSVYLDGGTVSNCVICSARTKGDLGDGAVIVKKGRVTRCVFRDCQRTDNSSSFSCGLTLDGENGSSTADNCLFVECGNPQNDQHVVKLLNRSRNQAYNLTVVNSTVKTGCYGIYTAGDTPGVYNSVVAGVKNADGESVPWGGTTSCFSTCAFDAECAGGSSCVFGTAAEFFKDVGRGKFQPKLGGPLFNAGNNDYVNSEIDLAGMPRILSKTVDIGCYESPQIGFNIIVR